MKKTLLTLCIVCIVVSGCCKVSTDDIKHPEPEFRIGDIAVLRLLPETQVHILSLKWDDDIGWAYYVRNWTVPERTYRNGDYSQKVYEFELMIFNERKVK